MGRDCQIVGACSGWGAPLNACEKGPEELGEKGVKMELLYPAKRANGVKEKFSEVLGLIEEFNQKLAKRVAEVMRAGKLPVVIGGDHVNAVGTWNGVRTSGTFGLIWIDAHLDSHTTRTSLSGAWHGMPLAALLGYGERRLSELMGSEPVLDPQRVVVIGARSFESGEAWFLRRLQVKVYFMEEVRKRGLGVVLQEAVEKVTQGVNRFGVSFDLDALDPSEAPGVGTPEEGGLRGEDVLLQLDWLGQDPRLVALEIVEFNPEKDSQHQTRDFLYEMVKRVV